MSHMIARVLKHNIFYCNLHGRIKGIFRAIYCIILQHSISFILTGHYRKTDHNPKQLPSQKRPLLSLKRPATHLQKPPQQFGPLTSEEDLRCAAKGVSTLNTKRHSHLQTTSASGQDKRSSVTSHCCYCFDYPVVQNAECPLVQRLCNLRNNTFAAHRKSSSLIRGPYHCGGFCTCVAGFLKESNSLFHDVELFYLHLLCLSEGQIAMVASVDVWQFSLRKVTAYSAIGAVFICGQ